jgi:hypothetical protein
MVLGFAVTFALSSGRLRMGAFSALAKMSRYPVRSVSATVIKPD